jgi:hypothetical protein
MSAGKRRVFTREFKLAVVKRMMAGEGAVAANGARLHRARKRPRCAMRSSAWR